MRKYIFIVKSSQTIYPCIQMQDIFSFPKNKDHADIWVDTILANTAQKSVNRSAVCAKHFLSTDFVNGHRKSTAVPSIFDP